MEDLIFQVKTFFQKYPESLFLVILIVVVLLERILKKVFLNIIPDKVQNYIKKIADDAVLHSAIFLNSETGQAKLEAAVKYIQDKIECTPWYIKIFIGKFDKAELVDIIEYAYSLYVKKTQSTIPEDKLDIKGNEIKKN